MRVKLLLENFALKNSTYYQVSKNEAVNEKNSDKQAHSGKKNSLYDEFRPGRIFFYRFVRLPKSRNIISDTSKNI